MDSENKKLAEYVRRMQNSDSNVFQEIYNLTYQKAYFTALKICKSETDAEDVLQDSYMDLLSKVGEVKNPDSFMSWFNMVVANKSRNFLRKNNPALFESEEQEQFVLDSIPDEDREFRPSEDVEQGELRESVMSLVDGLSDEKRTAIILYYYDEMSTREISESLGINENTVKSRLVQAKKDLAKGVKELEKKNGKLLGVAPIPLVIWALRGSSKASAAAFTASGAAATTYATITAAGAGTAVATTAGVAGGTAAAGGVIAKIAGFTVAEKIIAGVVTVGIVVGGAVGVSKAVETGREKRQEQTSITQEVNAPQTSSGESTSSSVAMGEETQTTGNETTVAGETTTTGRSETTTTATGTTKSGETTKPTTTTSATTKPTARSTTATRTTTRTTTRATTRTTTTVGKATVNITVVQSGVQRGQRAVTVDAGETFTFDDAKRYVQAMGYDTSYAVPVGAGSLPIKAESGRTYSVVIDVE